MYYCSSCKKKQPTNKISKNYKHQFDYCDFVNLHIIQSLKMRKQNQKEFEKLLKKGICVQCKQNKGDTSLGMCINCAYPNMPSFDDLNIKLK